MNSGFKLINRLDFEELKDRKVNVSVGTFDAIHKGHLKVLKTLVEYSHNDKVTSVVITFKNRPRQFLTGEDGEIINPNIKRIKIFESLGINVLILINFTKSLANMSPDKFILNLMNLFVINRIIVGEDFRFGINNEGDIDFLKRFSKLNGFKTEIVKLQKYKNKKISTSLIKDFIKKGDMERVTDMLGRYYDISGKVIKGEKLGTKLGFPTANLKQDFKNQILPGNGVYMSLIKIDGKIFKGLTYIGRKYVGKLKNRDVIESYILNFSQNIYGKKISVFFIKRLRKEIKFSNINDLQKQMDKDKRKILEVKNEFKKRNYYEGF